jgi:hypothetical protein
MGKLYEARFSIDRMTGKLDMNRPMEMPRMTMEATQQQRGYRRLTDEEFKNANLGNIDYGFAVMKTARGELRAVRYVED